MQFWEIMEPTIMDQPAIPPYFLPRPNLALDAGTRADFERLYAAAVAPGTGDRIVYDLATPKWQFLVYLADEQGLLLHGSGNGDIAEFEPRQSNDSNPFGAQRAVYAAADGLWPMYFAILDREHYPMHLINGAMQVAVGDGPLSEPLYFFSISQDARAQAPWRDGFVYLLPAAGFMRMPPMQLDDLVVHVPQAANLSPVKPLAQLAIRPADFPFLDQIRGHDDQVVAARAAARPYGFPWVDPA